VLKLSVDGRTVNVESTPFVIGRESDCDLVLEDPRVSRHHAQLEVLDDGRVVLRDLESANGTYVGEERISGGVWFDIPGSFRVGRTPVAVERAAGRTDETVALPGLDGATMAIDAAPRGEWATAPAPVAAAMAAAASPVAAVADPVEARQVAASPYESVGSASPVGFASAPPAQPAAWPRTAATRALAAQGALALSRVAALGTLVLFIRGFGLVDAIDEGSVSDAELLAFEAQSGQASLFILVTMIVSAIAFLAWLSRSVENAPLLELGTPPESPQRAILWWFVPIANLFKPLGIVKDLYLRLGGAAAPVALVSAWWFAWIAGGLLDRYAGFVIGGADTTEDIRAGFAIGIIAEVGVVVAAVLAIILVRRMQAWADAHATRLQAGARST
jgi:hypothetical protein